ncbi:MAG: hypothetical protein ACI9AT_002269 [Ulvibacter sp.]|jgi:hypothetical protein
MKKFKIIHYVSTGLLSALMLFSASMYFFNNADVQMAFTTLGFPTYIIYPLAIAKLLGLVAIWTKKYKSLTEWAYAGFFFNSILAFSAHYMVGDGDFPGALMALAFVLVSYYTYKKAFVQA